MLQHLLWGLLNVSQWDNKSTSLQNAVFFMLFYGVACSNDSISSTSGSQNRTKEINKWKLLWLQYFACFSLTLSTKQTLSSCRVVAPRLQLKTTCRKMICATAVLKTLWYTVGADLSYYTELGHTQRCPFVCLSRFFNGTTVKDLCANTPSLPHSINEIKRSNNKLSTMKRRFNI